MRGRQRRAVRSDATGGAVVALMAMHVAVAAVTVGTLRRLLLLR